jgi:hypothetical protein
METNKSMVSNRDPSQQYHLGSSGRSLQEIEAYLTRGRQLQAEFTAAFARASGFKLKTEYLRLTTTLAKAGRKIWGAGEILYYYFFRTRKSGVIFKCKQR